MRVTSILIILIFSSLSVMANNYEVSVTRKGSNIYKINSADAFIQTKHCYEHVYGENAFLKMHGRYGEIIFLDSGGKCDVKGVYSKVNQPSGKYKVSVSQDGDNWYEIWGQNLYIKTDMCLSLALGEEAILSISAQGFGTMYVGGDECMVEGIYARQNL